MAKILEMAVILLYLGVGIIIGAIIMVVSANVNLGMGIGGIIALVAAGLYALVLWKWKRSGQTEGEGQEEK